MTHRILHLLFFICLAFIARSATYHVSPGGDDGNSGTSPAQAWRTVARVQQAAGNLVAGDQVLFERGGSYPGQLTLNVSGASANPITIGAYGTGAAPILSGGVPVTGWIVHQGNIWRASVAQAVKYVQVNGSHMTLARYPNSGWLRNGTGSSTTLNSGGLTQGNGYWNGARLVVRSNNWCYETPTVSSFANGTLSFPAITYNLGNLDWGFYLCNKLSELDSPGEWFHDANSGVLYLWAPDNADPNSLFVEASVHDHGVVAGWQRQHIRIQDLAFRGQRLAGVRNDGASHVTITRCRFEGSYMGISSYGTSSTYTENVLIGTLATGILAQDNNSVIADNQLTDIAVRPGLGESTWGYFGIYAIGNGNQLRGNRLQNIGYSGIFLKGNNVTVERNIIRNAVSILNDGGGIHYDEVDAFTVQDNIVMDLTSNLESAAPDHNAHYPICHGIYFGFRAITNAVVQRNTVARCLGSGIHVDHSMVTSGVQVLNNVLYGNGIQLSISDYSNNVGTGATPPFHVPNYNDVYSGNVLYSLTRDQLCMKQFHVYSANPVDFGTWSNNRYFNPFNELSIFIQNIVSGSQRYYTLERWRAERGEDQGSTRSPMRLNTQEVTQVIGQNLLTNGTFQANVTGWTGWPTQGQISRDLTFLDNGALRLQFNNGSTSAHHYLRPEALVGLQDGSWYELRFSLQSDMHGILNTQFKTQNQFTGPLSIMERPIPFDSERRDVSILFQANNTEPGTCRFINHHTESRYWLDNVTLQRVQVAAVDPTERHVLFLNESAASQTITLEGCWRDVGGSLHSGDITLPPYGSVVLVHEPDETCGLTTDIEEQGLTEVDEQAPYPNPARAGGPLYFPSAHNAPLEAGLYDAAGRLAQRAQLPAGTLQIDLSSALVAGPYLLVLRTPDSMRHHRLVVE